MTKVFDCAVRLLTRREHGEQELADKLTQKGYHQEEIREVIVKCQHLGLQADARFAASLCRTRITQGYGPLKIIQELQAKHIHRDLINKALEQEQDHWVTYALAVWHKKYKNKGHGSFAELKKRQGFLLYRGFPIDVITAVMKSVASLSEGSII